MKQILGFTFILLFFSLLGVQKGIAQTNDSFPNILLIIADDMGVDVTPGYHQTSLLPSTPTLDSLRAAGITFTQAWSAPSCSPTRASIMSGKYGIKTGVLKVPGNLDLKHTSLFKAIDSSTNSLYDGAVIGKWHISNPVNYNHPAEHGVSYYSGVFEFGVDDYNRWLHTENGVSDTDSNYVTTVFTDEAISWINSRKKPWLTWLAHVAPHSPIHTPPAHMYTISAVGTNYRKYLAMIESVDYELNRLLLSIPDSVEENTLIIFIGDNGTPNNVLQNYPSGQAKGTAYEGGIRVPMIIAGKGVTRVGEKEDALIHVADIHATVLDIVGNDLDGGVYNSLSFKHLLDGTAGARRPYNYSEIVDGAKNMYCIRNDRYKMIVFPDSGDWEFYDLQADSLEFNDLSESMTPAALVAKTEFETELAEIRNYWSCNDFIKNGDEDSIDCGGSRCAPCVSNVSQSASKGTSIYPNPNSGSFVIKSKEIIESISIVNLLGQVVYDQSSFDNVHQVYISLDQSSNQMLFVHVMINGSKETLKVNVVKE